jgi:aromatic-L-amino-acid decarboxylase
MEMTGESLRVILEQCERDGLEPFYLTTTMGTTNTCAVDRFAEIKAVLQEKKEWQRIWVHVDAAYAGAALVVPECQCIAKEWAEGIDSFNMNMHKWLLVNFDARFALSPIPLLKFSPLLQTLLSLLNSADPDQKKLPLCPQPL